MNNPENSWFRPKPPHDELIEDVWGDLLQITCNELGRFALDGSPVLKYLAKRTAKDLHACITTLEALQEEEEDELATADEMPSFYAEATDEEGQTHFASEPGGIMMHDVVVDIDERSELRLEMAIRTIQKRAVTAGIIDHHHRSIQIPHNLGLKFVSQLSRKYRRAFADIMLYQLAALVARDNIDEEYEDANNLAAIIENHLDMPNVRAFHALLAGKQT